jgi:hypothetical protein
MNSRECERAIAKKLREIWDIYQRYYPGGEGLSVIVTDQTAWVWNGESLTKGEKPLDYYEIVREVGADANDEE